MACRIAVANRPLWRRERGHEREARLLARGVRLRPLRLGLLHTKCGL